MQLKEAESLGFDKLFEHFQWSTDTNAVESTLTSGVVLILNHSRRLSTTEYWNTLESICLAAVHLGDEDWVSYCLKKLRQRFPGSTRVQRLVVATDYGRGSRAKATTMCKELLDDHPLDPATRRLAASVHRGEGAWEKHIASLVSHLEDCVADTQGWHELALAYMATASWKKALFCFEELLVHDPTNLFSLLTYAELLSSTGEYDSAMQYFCQALEVDPSSLRAMFGIFTLKPDKRKAGTNEKVLQQAEALLDTEMEHMVVARLAAKKLHELSS